MKTKELETELSRYLFSDSTIGVCARFVGAGYAEMDVAKLTSTDYVYEYELKISRGDFLKETKNYTQRIDRQKFWKHLMMNEAYNNSIKKVKRKTSSIPNKYYFVCPENLIKKEELLEHQGLIYVTDNYDFKIIKEAKFLHKEKISLKLLKRFIKTLSERDTYDGKSKVSFNLKHFGHK